jgi:hypothetical protein
MARTSIAAAVLLPAVFFAVVAWLSHRQALSEGASRLDPASRVAQEHAMRVIETNEVVAQTILNFIGAASDAEIRDHEADLHEKLKSITAKQAPRNAKRVSRFPPACSSSTTTWKWPGPARAHCATPAARSLMWNRPRPRSPRSIAAAAHSTCC